MSSSVHRHSLPPYLGLALRIGLSVLLLWVLFLQLPDVTLEDLSPNWTGASWLWLGAAAITKFAAFALSTRRWQKALAPLATPPPWRRMFSHFLAGQFVSNILPSAFGGDVVRVSRLASDVHSSPIAFASVAIERLTGWLVLPTITFVALALQPDLTDLGHASTVAVTISGATLFGLVVVLLVASNRRFTGDLNTATGWRRFLIAVHLGVDALRVTPRAAIDVVYSGLAFQITQSAAVWMAAEAIGLEEVSFGVAMAFFPVSAIIQNLPIGLGGLGVREGSFVLFFGAVGAPEGLSITLGLLVYFLTILSSVAGAPSFIVGNRPGRDALKRVRAHEDVD